MGCSQVTDVERLTLAMWFSRDSSHDEDSNLASRRSHHLNFVSMYLLPLTCTGSVIIKMLIKTYVLISALRGCIFLLKEESCSPGLHMTFLFSFPFRLFSSAIGNLLSSRFRRAESYVPAS
ncbi:unnamed protein product, partial [Brassica napus]